MFKYYFIKYKMEICISNVQQNTTKNDIFNTFTKKNIGLISKIDFVNKLNYKIAFIKFNKFYENNMSKSFLEKMKNNVQVYLVYENGWFWKCSFKQHTTNTNKYVREV